MNCWMCGGSGVLCDPGKFGEPDDSTLRECPNCDGSGKVDNPPPQEERR